MKEQEKIVIPDNANWKLKELMIDYGDGFEFLFATETEEYLIQSLKDRNLVSQTDHWLDTDNIGISLNEDGSLDSIFLSVYDKEENVYLYSNDHFETLLSAETLERLMHEIKEQFIQKYGEEEYENWIDNIKEGNQEDYFPHQEN